MFVYEWIGGQSIRKTAFYYLQADQIFWNGYGVLREKHIFDE